MQADSDQQFRDSFQKLNVNENDQVSIHILINSRKINNNLREKFIAEEIGYVLGITKDAVDHRHKRCLDRLTDSANEILNNE